MQRVTFTTDDDVRIVGSWVTAPTTVGAAVLLHMFPATRASWGSFQNVLAQRGIASLAIDLRGHGESIRLASGAEIDFRRFTDGEHLSSMNDVRSAFEWVRGREIEPERIAVVGASIGANLALRLLAEEPRCPAAALLSPGLSYHGVSAEEAADNVAPHQSVWAAASAGDDDESVAACEKLSALLGTEQKTFRRLDDAGHGTYLFDADAVFMGELADWLRDRIQGGGGRDTA